MTEVLHVPSVPSRRYQRETNKTRGIFVYLAISFGLGWLAQIAVVNLLSGVSGGLASLGPGALIAGALLMWPPAIGAVVAHRFVEHGRQGNLGLRWPGWGYALLAWFGPALLTALTMLASLPIYPFDPSFSTVRVLASQSGQPLPADPAMIVAGQLALALTLAVPINALLAFGEELGWRGYLLPRLMQRLGVWPGVLLHGAIWGFWHAPLIVLSGYNYPGHNLLGVPWFIISCALLGVLFGWLRLGSGSVFAPTIAHAAFNAIGPAPLLLLRNVDAAIGGVLWSPIGWLVMLLVIGALAATGRLDRGLRRDATSELVPF